MPLLALAKRILPEFLRWHFLTHPQEILREYVSYAGAFASAFSFVYLLRTLFSPWKAIVDVYPHKGFNLAEISSVFALNMTARCVGAFIRLGAMLVGILVEIACLAFFVAYFCAWIAYPLLLPASIITFFATVFR